MSTRFLANAACACAVEAEGKEQARVPKGPTAALPCPCGVFPDSSDLAQEARSVHRGPWSEDGGLRRMERTTASQPVAVPSTNSECVQGAVAVANRALAGFSVRDESSCDVLRAETRTACRVWRERKQGFLHQRGRAREPPGGASGLVFPAWSWVVGNFLGQPSLQRWPARLFSGNRRHRQRWARKGWLLDCKGSAVSATEPLGPFQPQFTLPLHVVGGAFAVLLPHIPDGAPASGGGQQICPGSCVAVGRGP